jgi:hypothetical protein
MGIVTKIRILDCIAGCWFGVRSDRRKHHGSDDLSADGLSLDLNEHGWCLMHETGQTKALRICVHNLICARVRAW